MVPGQGMDSNAAVSPDGSKVFVRRPRLTFWSWVAFVALETVFDIMNTRGPPIKADQGGPRNAVSAGDVAKGSGRKHDSQAKAVRQAGDAHDFLVQRGRGKNSRGEGDRESRDDIRAGE
jgi:hypothetical protein